MPVAYDCSKKPNGLISMFDELDPFAALKSMSTGLTQEQCESKCNTGDCNAYIFGNMMGEGTCMPNKYLTARTPGTVSRYIPDNGPAKTCFKPGFTPPDLDKLPATFIDWADMDRTAPDFTCTMQTGTDPKSYQAKRRTNFIETDMDEQICKEECLDNSGCDMYTYNGTLPYESRCVINELKNADGKSSIYTPSVGTNMCAKGTKKDTSSSPSPSPSLNPSSPAPSPSTEKGIWNQPWYIYLAGAVGALIVIAILLRIFLGKK